MKLSAILSSLAGILLLVLLFLLATILPAPAISTISLIDDFGAGPQVLDLSGATGSLNDATLQPGSGILGAERKITFTVSGNPLGATALASVDAGPSMFTANLGSSVSGVALVQYHGFNGGGLGGLNFAADGNDSFILRVDALSSAMELSLTITDTSNRTATLDTTLPDPVASMRAFAFPFGLFENGAGADFGRVDRFSIQLSRGPGATRDVSLELASIAVGSAVAAVPEPSCLIMLTFAAGACLLRRERTRGRRL